MVTLHDVPADDLIQEVADRLEDRIDEPDWAAYVTTGQHTELPPQQDDFWYVRAASVLRKVALNGPIGVERLATSYGGAKDGSTRYRVAPPSHAPGSRKIIRTVLQQLEEEGLVEIAQGEGRRVTDQGRGFLDDVAGELLETLDRPELDRYA